MVGNGETIAQGVVSVADGIIVSVSESADETPGPGMIDAVGVFVLWRLTQPVKAG